MINPLKLATFEEIAGPITNLDELSREKYLELKNARLSDNLIINVLDSTTGLFNEFKKKNNLIGVTIPGYENVTASRRNYLEAKKTKEQTSLEIPEINAVAKSNEGSETIIEGFRNLPPIRADNVDLHLALAEADEKVRSLEKTIIELKNTHKEELNRITAELRLAHETDLNAIKNLTSEENTDDSKYLLEALELRGSLQDASLYIKGLESKIEYLENEVHHVSISTDEDVLLYIKKLDFAKKIIKQMVKLL